METLEEIKNVRNGLEGYVGEEYDFRTRSLVSKTYAKRYL